MRLPVFLKHHTAPFQGYFPSTFAPWISFLCQLAHSMLPLLLSPAPSRDKKPLSPVPLYPLHWEHGILLPPQIQTEEARRKSNRDFLSILWCLAGGEDTWKLRELLFFEDSAFWDHLFFLSSSKLFHPPNLSNLDLYNSRLVFPLEK